MIGKLSAKSNSGFDFGHCCIAVHVWRPVSHINTQRSLRVCVDAVSTLLQTYYKRASFSDFTLDRHSAVLALSERVR